MEVRRKRVVRKNNVVKKGFKCVSNVREKSNEGNRGFVVLERCRARQRSVVFFVLWRLERGGGDKALVRGFLRQNNNA